MNAVHHRWPRIDPAQARALRDNFGFPDDIDMQALLLWAGSVIPLLELEDFGPTDAAVRDKFAALKKHLDEAERLLEDREVNRFWIFATDKKTKLLRRLRDAGLPVRMAAGIDRLQAFATAGLKYYSPRARRGPKLQQAAWVRELIGLHLLTIWTNYQGDPRGSRKAVGKFYAFAAQAFELLGRELGDGERREVERKLRKAKSLLDFPDAETIETMREKSRNYPALLF